MAKDLTERPYNVLFLCTGNSARSILAEALLNHWGRGRVRGFSAGSHPRGSVHPMALELLRRLELPTEGLRSKSWAEFARPGVEPLDLVVTVCDNAAAEVCPYWPGGPLTVHWGLPDPAAVEGAEAEKQAAFRATLQALEYRIRTLTGLPLAALDRATLSASLQAIGGMRPPAASPG
jgi:arsenate reductase (thioredoxin)